MGVDTVLFAIFVVLGFVLWFASALPGSRLPEYWARLSWLTASVLWAIPLLAGLA